MRVGLKLQNGQLVFALATSITNKVFPHFLSPIVHLKIHKLPFPHSTCNRIGHTYKKYSKMNHGVQENIRKKWLSI